MASTKEALTPKGPLEIVDRQFEAPDKEFMELGHVNEEGKFVWNNEQAQSLAVYMGLGYEENGAFFFYTEGPEFYPKSSTQK